MEKYLILKVKDGSFEGSGGEPVEYYWTKAKRIADGVTIEFGTRENYTEKIGQELELEIEKLEKAGGGFRYKELL